MLPHRFQLHFKVEHTVLQRKVSTKLQILQLMQVSPRLADFIPPIVTDQGRTSKEAKICEFVATCLAVDEADVIAATLVRGPTSVRFVLAQNTPPTETSRGSGCP
jgi:hypothetical protein